MAWPSYDAGTARLTIEPDFGRTFETIDAKVRAHNPPPVSVSLELGSTTTFETKVRQAVDSVGVQTIDVRLRADAESFRDDVQRAVDSQGRNVTVGLRLDPGNFRADLSQELTAAQGYDVQVGITLDVAGFRAAVATEVQAAARDVTVPVRADATGLRGQIENELAGQQATVPIKLDLTGAYDRYNAFRGHIERTPIVAPFKLDLTGAYDRYNAFRGHAQRDMRAEFDLDTARAMAQLAQMRAAMNGLGGGMDFGGGLGSVGNDAAEAGGGMASLAKSMSTVMALAPVALGAVGSLGIGLLGLGAAAGAAAAAVTVGLNGVMEAFQAGTAMDESAAKDAEAAAKATETAARQVESAEREVTQAQKSSQQAQEDLTRARKQAKEQIEDLNLALKGSALDEESAALAVEEAYERMNEVMADPEASETQRKRAELSHREAIQRLAEVRERNGDLAAEAQAANEAGIEGAEGVVAAKERVAQAAQAEIDAERALADAQLAFAEAMSGSSDAADTYAQKLAELSPNARAFVESMRELAPIREAFGDAVQDGLFAGIGDSAKTAIETILPAIQEPMAGLAETLGGMFAGAMNLLSGPGLEPLQKIIEGSSEFFAEMGPGLGQLLQGFLDLGAAAAPMMGTLGTAFADLFGSIGEAFSNLTDGTMQNLMSGFAEVITGLGPVLGPLISMLGTLGATVGPILADLFAQIGPMITELIPPFKQIAQVVGTALVEVFSAIAPVVPVVADAFASLFSAAAPLIGPIAQIVAVLVEALAPALATIFDALGPVITQFAQALMPVISQLAPILAQVAAEIANGLVLAIQAIAPSLPILAESFGQIVLAIAPILPQLAQLISKMLPPLMALFNDLIVTILPPLTDAFTWLAEKVLPIVATAISWLADQWGQNIDRIRGAFNSVKDWLEGAFDAVARNVKGFVDKIGELWDGLPSKLSTPINWVIEHVYNGGIVKFWNMIADKVGLGKLDEIAPIKLAGGGRVAGPGGPKDDMIPAMLSNGEHVLTAQDVQNLGGHDAVYALREQAAHGGYRITEPNYANGGAVGWPGFAIGGEVSFGSEVDRWMADVIQNQFPDATITSAYRPGHSGFHGKAQAVDIDAPAKQPIADWIYATYPESEQLIWGPGPLLYNVGGTMITDQNQLRNQVYAGDLAGHYDHIHWANDNPLEALSAEESRSLWDRVRAGVGGAIGSAIGALRSFIAEQFERPMRALGETIPDPVPGIGEFGRIPKAAFDKLTEAAISWVRGKGDEKAGSSGASLGAFGGSSMDYAKVIVDLAKELGLGEHGAKVGLMTALAESGLRMYANNSVPESLAYPHDAVGSDHDSVGLFQQRDNGAWGTVEQRMNPRASAQMFYDALMRVDGWQNMPPHLAAQAVQRSAFSDGSNYAAQAQAADELLAQLYDAGGVMEPGQVAVNLSGKPEAVFTHAEWQVLDALVQMLGQTGLVDALVTTVADAQSPAAAPISAAAASPGSAPAASSTPTPLSYEDYANGAGSSPYSAGALPDEAIDTYDQYGDPNKPGATGPADGGGNPLLAAIATATGGSVDSRPVEERMAAWGTEYSGRWANWGQETVGDLINDIVSPTGFTGINVGQLVTQDVPEAMTRLARLADMAARGYTRTNGR
ncbi:Phage-related protein [Mycobacteroides abscessus subsp. abscessus]|nr:Phage-related protein [Mycobacteroides abscessus subsp. abscessus]